MKSYLPFSCCNVFAFCINVLEAVGNSRWILLMDQFVGKLEIMRVFWSLSPHSKAILFPCNIKILIIVENIIGATKCEIIVMHQYLFVGSNHHWTKIVSLEGLKYFRISLHISLVYWYSSWFCKERVISQFFSLVVTINIVIHI